MIRSIDPELCNISLAANIDALIWSSEQYLSIVELYPDEVMLSRYYNYMKQFKLDSIATFFKEIISGDIDLNAIKTADMDTTIVADNLKLKSFSNQFKLFWLEEFWSQHQSVKASVYKSLGEDNEYYVNFSESIGCLTFLEFIKTNSVLKWTDPAHEEQDIEYTVTGSTFNKMSQNSQMINTYLSKVTNTILKSNTQNLINLNHAIDSTTSHGSNFVTDAMHYERVIGIIDELKKPIQIALGGLYDILTFIKNSDNQQYINPLTIDVNVEGIQTNITLQQKALREEPTMMSNNDILGG